jgi:hypothetical protein
VLRCCGPFPGAEGVCFRVCGTRHASSTTLVEPLDGACEREVLAGGLQALDEVGGAGEQDAEAVVDEGVAEGGGKMALAGAGRAEQQDIAPRLEPAVPLGERQKARLAGHRHGGEVEAVEGLARREVGGLRMAGDAALLTLGQLVLGQGGEEACRGPALGIGRLGDALPEPAEGGQAQLVQQHRQAGGVDGDAAHRASSGRSAS